MHFFTNTNMLHEVVHGFNKCLWFNNISLTINNRFALFGNDRCPTINETLFVVCFEDLTFDLCFSKF